MFAEQHIIQPGLDMRLFPEWLGSEADVLFARLLAELPWQQRHVRLFGREIPEPRLTDWSADPGVRYRYSGIVLGESPWHPTVDALRHTLSTQCGVAFNSVLANHYRDGQDAMGWHADDEPELGPEPVIASLSLGATRRLELRHRHRRDLPTCRLELASGALLVMAGRTQHDWQHRIPRERGIAAPRINLTFRRIIRP